MKEKISIIIRTKNEERWIVQCLQAVYRQNYRNFEVIIVDNESTDCTVEKSRQFPVAKILSCTDYLPGKALNSGIRESDGEFITCLSGHCIPVNDKWLENLLKNFAANDVAGVYGRQEPMSFSSDSDKRDLALVFGLDKRTQIKDSFFHNANSMIRRDIWEKIPFDEAVSNIEDRVWAKKVLESGYKIVYEPEAGVYHYHGIHQNGDAERCAKVVRIMEGLIHDKSYKSIEMDKLNIVAIIPVKGPARYINDEPLLSYTIKRAKESKFIKKTIVSTDDAALADLAKRLGAEAPFLRDKALSEGHVNLVQVLKYSLEEIENIGILPDLIVSLEITFPFRPKGLIDDMISQLAKKGLDTITAARIENRAIWKEHDGRMEQLDEGLTPRQFKDPSFIELKGVACITHPEFVRQSRMMGDRIGIYEVKDPYSHLEVRNDSDFKMASALIKKVF